MTREALVLSVAGRIGDEIVRELDAAGVMLDGVGVAVVHRAVAVALDAEVATEEQTRALVRQGYRRGLAPDKGEL